MTKPTLIYFNARGRAEVIRLLLSEADVGYDVHPVGKGTPDRNGRPTDFAALKATGLLPFEALPVWEEPDGFRLAQSRAIECHIARGHGLYGRTAREIALCDQLLGAYDDVRVELRKLVSSEPAKRPGVREELQQKTLPRWTGYLDRLLAGNRGGEGFVVGDGATIADFALFYLLELMRDNGFGEAIDRAPRLVAFAERLAARPSVRAYVTSPARPAFVPLPG